MGRGRVGAHSEGEGMDTVGYWHQVGTTESARDKHQVHEVSRVWAALVSVPLSSCAPHGWLSTKVHFPGLQAVVAVGESLLL